MSGRSNDGILLETRINALDLGALVTQRDDIIPSFEEFEVWNIEHISTVKCTRVVL